MANYSGLTLAVGGDPKARSRRCRIRGRAAGASATVGMAIVDRWLTDRIVATLARQSSPRLATTDPATYVNADLGFFVLVLVLFGTLGLNALADLLAAHLNSGTRYWQLSP